MTFTPGPWRIQGEDEMADGVPAIEIVRDVDYGPDFEQVAYIPGQFEDEECEGDIIISDRVRANAHLIAAAPELLEALKAYQKLIPTLQDIPELIAHEISTAYINAMAAIAKAEGK